MPEMPAARLVQYLLAPRDSSVSLPDAGTPVVFGAERKPTGCDPAARRRKNPAVSEISIQSDSVMSEVAESSWGHAKATTGRIGQEIPGSTAQYLTGEWARLATGERGMEGRCDLLQRGRARARCHELTAELRGVRAC
jgi:hypothetical protein